MYEFQPADHTLSHLRTIDRHKHKVIQKMLKKHIYRPQEHKHENNLRLLLTALITRFVWFCTRSAFPLSLGLNANVKATL